MNKNPILKWIIALSIAIVLNLLFNYSLSLIFNEPQYDEIFPRIAEVHETQEFCEENGHVWVNQDQRVIAPVEKQITNEITGYCDTYTKSQAQWDELRGEYEKKVFASLILLGVITIILSVIIKNNVVSLGLGLGAFLDFIVSSTRYWRYSDDWLRVVILAIALAVLIWLAIKKFGDKN
jgi:hypothetical protein